MFTDISDMKLRVIPGYSITQKSWDFSNGANDLKYEMLS